MPIVSGITISHRDRVQETTTTTGTGAYRLIGPVSGQRSFLSTFGSGARASYVVVMDDKWEEGIGTVTSPPPTISRQVILSSSSGGAAVNWSGGTKAIFSAVSAAVLDQIWQRPASGALAFIEERGPISPAAGSNRITFGSIASTARIIHLAWSNLLQSNNNRQIAVQLGSGGTVFAAGYVSAWGGINSVGGKTAGSIGHALALIGAGGTPPVTKYGKAVLVRLSPTFWTISGTCSNHSQDGSANPSTHYSAGAIFAPLDRVDLIINQTTANDVWAAGGSVACQIIHGVS